MVLDDGCLFIQFTVLILCYAEVSSRSDLGETVVSLRWCSPENLYLLEVVGSRAQRKHANNSCGG